MKKLEIKMSVMETENQILKERLDEYKKRISILEGPGFRKRQHLRSMDEFEMPMLADNMHPSNYDKFRWVIPKEALFVATDEAL
jgi:hypothetical protein